MGNLYRVMSVAGIALLVGACAGFQLDGARGLEQQGGPFDEALYAGYIDLATDEYGEGDYDESDAYAMKASSAAAGDAVRPYELSDRSLPADAQPAIASARARLLTALDASGRTKLPGQAARAQNMFDCWVEEQAENRQPDDIAACRDGFLDAIAQVEAALKPPAMAKPAPPPPAMVDPRSWIVYYSTDESGLTDAAIATVAEAAAYAKTSETAMIVVSGHTDRAGSEDYNEGLSADRAEAVADAFREHGFARGVIALSSYGESDPAVDTPDGQPEERNRRVEIQVREK